MRGGARRLVGDQELHHHLLGRDRAVAGRFHLHADGRCALAGGRKHPLAFDLHHAGAAVAVGAIIRLRRIAEMGDLGAEPLGNLPDGFAHVGFDLLTVELERDGRGFGWRFAHSATSLRTLPVRVSLDESMTCSPDERSDIRGGLAGTIPGVASLTRATSSNFIRQLPPAQTRRENT